MSYNILVLNYWKLGCGHSAKKNPEMENNLAPIFYLLLTTYVQRILICQATYVYTVIRKAIISCVVLFIFDTRSVMFNVMKINQI